jgi:hypothetical protein
MAAYYNKTLSPIAVDLRGGGSVSFPPKTWTNVAAEDEGAEMLVGFTKRGLLVRYVDPPEDKPAEHLAAGPVVHRALTVPNALVRDRGTATTVPVILEGIVESTEESDSHKGVF